MTTNSKALILYFSLTGNTAKAAKTVQALTGAAIEEIRPVKPYARDYAGATARGEKEKDGNIHPAMVPLKSDLSQYTTIYLGFPTWWAQPPMIIQTLADQTALAGKVIVPFTTSGGSAIADSEQALDVLAQRSGAALQRGFTANSAAEIKQFFAN